MWGNSKSSSKAVVPVSSASSASSASSVPRSWVWEDDHPDSFESTSFSTSIDIDDTPSSPGYTVLAGVGGGVIDGVTRKSLEGDPVESAIAEWSLDVADVTGSDITCDVSNDSDDSFNSTLCDVKQEDSFDERPVKKKQSRLPLKVTKPGKKRENVKREKSRAQSRAQTRDQTRDQTRSVQSRQSRAQRARTNPIQAKTAPPTQPDSLSLTLTRITCESAFHHRFLQSEDQLHSLAEEYLRSKRHGLPWTNPAQVDHALFDWAFVSRKSGLPKEAAVISLRLASPKRPVRWTPTDDRLILYLKEIEGLTWKESALMIRYRHSWQAVQMRYLRTLCRLTGKWTQQETEQLEGIVARDWAGRWKRIATEMGPQFPVERVYRRMMGLAGREVDLEGLDDVERQRDVQSGDQHFERQREVVELYCQ